MNCTPRNDGKSCCCTHARPAAKAVMNRLQEPEVFSLRPSQVSLLVDFASYPEGRAELLAAYAKAVKAQRMIAISVLGTAITMADAAHVASGRVLVAA